MRKPNITEATNEFVALAIQCEHSEQPAFAAHAHIGAARCEAAAGNFLGEAEHYVTAARHFMKAEKKLVSLKFYSPDRENLEVSYRAVYIKGRPLFVNYRHSLILHYLRLTSCFFYF